MEDGWMNGGGWVERVERVEWVDGGYDVVVYECWVPVAGVPGVAWSGRCLLAVWFEDQGTMARNWRAGVLAGCRQMQDAAAHGAKGVEI